MHIDDILSVPDSNPNLRPKVKDAREMFRYAAIFFLVAALINGLWGLWDIFAGIFWSAWGAYYSGYRIFTGILRLVLAVVAVIIKDKFVQDVITPIDQGQIRQSEDNMIIYMILGFVFGLIISGILILLGHMKLNEIDTRAKNCPSCGAPLRYIQQYDSWYCDNCGDYKVPGPSSESSPPPPPSPPLRPNRSTGQQTSQQIQPPPPEQQQKQCPQCGEDMRYIDEYNRWYCDRCRQYR